MDHFAGLDVSVKETSLCVVDGTGRIVREVKVASEPEALLAVLKGPAYRFKRIGLKAGPGPRTLRLARTEPEDAWGLTCQFVCAWCDVCNRKEVVQRDDQGRETMTWTWCAYCGRTELRFGKLGRQTPIPKKPPEPPDGFPF